MSDEDLLKLRLFYDDIALVSPYAIIAPPDWAEAVIQAKYSLPAPKGTKLLQCSLPGRHKHNQGFIMMSPSGVKFLAGIDCGKKEFGGDFAGLKTRHDTARKRQISVNRYILLKEFLPTYLEKITRIENDLFPRLIELADNSIDKFDSLLDHIGSDGRLAYDTFEEDFQATQRAKEAVAKELEKIEADFKQNRIKETIFKKRVQDINLRIRAVKPVMRQVTKYLKDRALGFEFLKEASSEQTRFAEADIVLRKTMKQMRHATSSDSFSNDELEDLIKAAKAAFKEIDNCLPIFESANRFYSNQNLGLLSQWAPMVSPSQSVTFTSRRVDIRIGEYLASIDRPGQFIVPPLPDPNQILDALPGV
ncbi:hypothetical protein [Gimibacter soli]|uniref:Uncharacterized protein n=1 Tax=Gimibacter soli TaxID=3024400 RepID=A0AAF0BHM2_9PROT|nr:hypothetical protein [Gimibacter soli]WCL54403.1 hypothetical protein PH603_01350 [Gimibacter soli]